MLDKVILDVRIEEILHNLCGQERKLELGEAVLVEVLERFLNPQELCLFGGFEIWNLGLGFGVWGSSSQSVGSQRSSLSAPPGALPALIRERVECYENGLAHGLLAQVEFDWALNNLGPIYMTTIVGLEGYSYVDMLGVCRKSITLEAKKSPGSHNW